MYLLNHKFSTVCRVSSGHTSTLVNFSTRAAHSHQVIFLSDMAHSLLDNQWLRSYHVSLNKCLALYRDFGPYLIKSFNLALLSH